MALSTATPKGQIVIPAELRRKYKIEPGSKVSVEDGDGASSSVRSDTWARRSRSVSSSASPAVRH